MDPETALHIELHADGDIVVSIVGRDGIPLNFGNGSVAQVEYCASGGRSYPLLPKLYELLKEMEKENQRDPGACPWYMLPEPKPPYE